MSFFFYRIWHFPSRIWDCGVVAGSVGYSTSTFKIRTKPLFTTEFLFVYGNADFSTGSVTFSTGPYSTGTELGLLVLIWFLKTGSMVMDFFFYWN